MPGKGGGVVDQGLQELLARQAAQLRQGLVEAGVLVEAPGGVARVGEAVGEDQEGVARREVT